MKNLIPLLFGLAGLTTAAQAQLFSDNFTRGSDPGPLAPWTNQLGTWTVTGGVMRGGTNTLFSYGVATITNNFTNCSVQARIRFQTNAFGGGLGGHVNPATGARYEAWIYPETSTSGATNVLKLLKFQNYTSFGYLGTPFAAIGVTNLTAVGTNFHTLKMDFSGDQITVAFDTNKAVMVLTDDEASTYSTGAVSLAFWTDSTGYLFTADDVTVSALPLVTSNDTYTVVSGLALKVAAPGVLENDSGGLGNLTALLASSPTHGTFTLTNNGGFTYTATNSYTGADSFTYRATDGVTTSSVTTVSLTVTANHAPVANDDSYTVVMNGSLTVPASGVLANDTDADGNSLTAAVVATTTHGTLSLSANGAFTYTPANGFSGSDSFTYRANDGLTNSATATATISVLSIVPLYSDSFSRTNLAPWIAQSGNWAATGTVLQGGTNSTFSYGVAYLTNSWTNYAVQARIQFPAGAFGGGIDACLNPATGARYSAWIYPEGSAGGSTMLKLIKFQNYASFSYNGVAGATMATFNLASVGTGFHTLQLATAGGRVAVSLDGAQLISVTDTDTGGPAYLQGGIGADFWTDAAGYLFTVDDVLVTSLVNDDSYAASQNTPLTVAAPGVLGNDTEIYGSSLTAVTNGGPSHGTLSLSANGGFTYTPTNGYTGVDSFLYRANDGPTNVGTARATITIVVLNHAPTLPAQTNRTIAELTPLSVTNTASDVDTLNTEAYTLTVSNAAGAVTNAAISTNGIITWSPTEVQGPSTNTFITIVTDNGAPPLSATNSFTVVVTESNSPPSFVLTPANQTVNEMTLMTITNRATDPDLPTNVLSYTLFVTNGLGVQVANAAISAAGVITWTPTEAQGPSTNTFRTIVTDTNPAAINTKQLSATNVFTVTVNEVNVAPVLPNQANRTITATTPLSVTNSATDSDLPANVLSYTLPVGPVGAVIAANTGIITWTPTTDQDHSTNLFRTVVTDDGSPPLSATNNFTVFVNSDPVIVFNSTTLAAEGCLSTNNAIDPGETVMMLFSLKNTGLGNTTNLVATLLSTNGVVLPSGPQTYGGLVAGGASVVQPFTFSATGACGSTLVATLQLQDGSTDLGTLTASFVLGPSGIISTQNFDTVSIPALPAGWTSGTSGVGTAWRTTNSVGVPVDTATNAAFVADVANIGTSDLISPSLVLPQGLTQLSFKHRYGLEADGNGFYDGGVVEIKIGTNGFIDIITAGGIFVTGAYNATISSGFASPIAGRKAWSGTIGFYTNTVISLPPAAAGQTVQLRWRLACDNGGTPGPGWRVDSIGLIGAACCINGPPVLPGQIDRTVTELTGLTITNTATDSSTLASNLNYSLVSPPDGAQISAAGVITWTPSEAQGPGAYSITTIVTDNALTPLSATNSFTVTVTESNSAPVLPFQADWTIAELTTLVVTNAATDADLPANALGYTLQSPPAGAAIDTNGIITWTPSEVQGPGTAVLVTVVTDDGVPALSATNSFTVTVLEVNTRPSLPAQGSRTVAELTTLSVNNAATDVDLPPNALSYSLLNPPPGLNINGSGQITWTPSEEQGPSTNIIVTVVTDDGVPPLSATNSFTVVVTEVNTAPVLPAQADRTISASTTLQVNNAATDTDLPANTLSYLLVSPPAGANIDGSGQITWTPTSGQAPSTNAITTVVTDDGVPTLSATNTFTVVVNPNEEATVDILLLTVADDVATLTWNSVTGRTYRLQYRTNIDDVDWNDLLPDVLATGVTATATNALDGAQQRFYRVKLLP